MGLQRSMHCNQKTKFQCANYMCCTYGSNVYALDHVRKITMGLVNIDVSGFGACKMTYGKAFSL